MMEFLYFPEDKSEYVGAFITLVIFMIGAVATMYIVYRHSNKEKEYFEDKYEDINKEHEKYKYDSEENESK